MPLICKSRTCGLTSRLSRAANLLGIDNHGFDRSCRRSRWLDILDDEASICTTTPLENHTPASEVDAAALNLGGEPLLHHRGFLPLGGQLGEVLLAVPGVRRPRGGEPVPQFVVAGLVEPGEGLPLVEQFAQPGDAVPPVGAGGDGLGLGGDLGLGGPRLLDLRGPLGLRFSRCWATSGVSASSRARRPSRSPTACASSIELVTFFTAARASSGDTVPAWTRFSSRSTSNASASYRRV